MTRISGSSSLKVQKSPPFWDISRKEHRFVIKPIPGPYAISESYPLGVLLRDILKLANNMREVKSILHDGKVKVDGKIRYDEHFPVGLMNIISIDPINKHYRLVASDKILTPVEIDEKESRLKICKIRNKVTIKGNRIQYGLHDGRTIINNSLNANPNDSLLIRVPEQEVVKVIKFEKGANVVITKGDNSGRLGVVEEIKEGTFTLPKRAVIKSDDRIIELPVNMMIVVGKDNDIPIRVN